MALRSRFEKGNEAFIVYDGKTKNGGNSRNTEFFTIAGNKLRSRGLPWLCPKGTSVKQRNNDHRNLY
jgi:hypothetical protein